MLMSMLMIVMLRLMSRRVDRCCDGGLVCMRVIVKCLV